MADPWFGGAQSFLPNGSTDVSVVIGPFLSATDGKTPVTGLTIAPADVKLSKNNGTIFSLTADPEANNAWDLGNGYYRIDIIAADHQGVQNGQEEILKVMVNKTGALPYFKDFKIRPITPA
jgi:hypothetical protein